MAVFAGAKSSYEFGVDGSGFLTVTSKETGAVDVVRGIERLEFDDGPLAVSSDEVLGGSSNLTLIGSDGADVLVGTDGNDTLIGNAGDDTLDGGLGNDILNGGAGNDVLIGDVTRGLANAATADFTTADYRDATGPITVTLSSEGSVVGDVSFGKDTLIGIDRVFGSEFDDTLTVDSTFSGSFGTWNEIEGGGGDDLIAGNGITRVGFGNADAGVVVDLGSGTASGIEEAM